MFQAISRKGLAHTFATREEAEAEAFNRNCSDDLVTYWVEEV